MLSIVKSETRSIFAKLPLCGCVELERGKNGAEFHILMRKLHIILFKWYSVLILKK